ncbi:DUF4367 domain-containing protein [Anaerococcus marasmi]|uniref:DUF4367 domain-containing protein n=1 Tax=Anaerococcus marasmi TaxID=2057797 RepID=UPI000CFA5614|nr:DUF4367 domain-containing protein [Anaerococcus marasmi]
MKIKKIFASAMTLVLAFGLMACSNDAKNNEDSKEETKVEEKAEDKTSEDNSKEDKKEETDKEAKDKKFDSPIYDVAYNCLPEDFEEIFRDEKEDLLTIEFGLKKNPAKKITVQVSDNEERFKELFKIPEDAEDVKVGEEDGKFWDDGSFRYLVVERENYSIYARSTLDKDETIKVVSEAK